MSFSFRDIDLNGVDTQRETSGGSILKKGDYVCTISTAEVTTNTKWWLTSNGRVERYREWRNNKRFY